MRFPDLRGTQTTRLRHKALRSADMAGHTGGGFPQGTAAATHSKLLREIDQFLRAVSG